MATLLAAAFTVSCTLVNENDTSTQSTANSLRIYSVHDQQMLSTAEFFTRLADAEYIMLGEEHGNQIDHSMQEAVLAGVLAAGRKPAVVMEMMDQQDAGVISSTLRQHPNNPDALANAVDWHNSGWPDWDFYRPIVKTALDSQLRVAPGNIPRKQLIGLAINGGIKGLEPRYAAQIALDQELPEAGELRLRTLLGSVHGHQMPKSAVDKLLFAQRMRDASLADAILSNNTGDGAVLIAGKEHSRSDYGVPFYLRHREPHSETVTVVSMSDTELSHFKHRDDSTGIPYQYIWLVSQPDYVAAMNID